MLTSLFTHREGSGSLTTWVRSSVAATVVAGCLASTVSLTAPVTAQAAPGVADFVPDTSLMYAEFELDQESAQFEKAAELLERANLTSLLDESQQTDLETGTTYLSVLADGKAGVFLSELPIEEGMTIEDLASDASDVGSDPEAVAEGDVPAGWTVVIVPTDAEQSFDMYSELVFSDADAEPDEIDYNGYTILSQPAADEYSEGVAIALVDDAIAIATTPDDIEPVIDTATGGSDPLSDDESYGEVRDALEEESLAFGYVNGPALLEAVNEQDPAIAEASPELEMSLTAHSGFVFWADDPGFRLDSIAFPAEGAELPPATSFEPTFVESLPDSSLVYAGGTDLGKTPGLDALALAIAQDAIGEDPLATPAADPEAYADEVFAEAEATIGFNLKTDVLDQLVGEWGIAGSVANVTSDEPDVEAVFVTEVDDAETVTEVTDSITEMISQQQDESFELTTRDVEGSEVTVISVPDSSPPMVIEFGVVNDQLVIGVNEGLDTFVEGADSPISESEGYQATFAELPTDVTGITYLNVQGMLPLIQDAIAATSSSALDADPACADYATQEEAQEAYDENFVDNYMLDADYDGEACEDFFAPATPEASPDGVSDVNVIAIGSVTVNDGDSAGSHTIILIGE